MIYRSYLINLLSLLICLLPFALLTGPFLPDLFLSFISLSFIILSIKEKIWKYYNNKFFYLLSCFYFVLIISSILSDFPIVSLESSLFYFRFGIFALAVWFIIENNKKFTKIFAIFLLITFCIALVDGFFQHFIDRSIFGYTYELQRMSLLLNHKLILGGYLSRLLPLLVAVLVFSFGKNKYLNYFLSILILISSVIIYLSGERTAIALFILFLFLLTILISKFRIYGIFILIFSLFTIFILTLYDKSITENVINKTINQVIDFDEGKINLFSKNHEPLIKNSIRMFLDNPILGVGPNQFRNICKYEEYQLTNKTCKTEPQIDCDCNTHPHNIYIQLLAETGFIGFSFLLGTLIYFFSLILINIFKNKMNPNNRLKDFYILLIISICLTLWPIIPSNNFFNNWINVIYYLPVGFLLYALNEEK
jgi:O-antigen ligase